MTFNNSLQTNRGPAFGLRVGRFFRTLDSLPVPDSGGGR